MTLEMRSKVKFNITRRFSTYGFLYVHNWVLTSKVNNKAKQKKYCVSGHPTDPRKTGATLKFFRVIEIFLCLKTVNVQSQTSCSVSRVTNLGETALMGWIRIVPIVKNRGGVFVYSMLKWVRDTYLSVHVCLCMCLARSCFLQQNWWP